MKEQRTKQILIYLAASLGCFWLGNRVGLLYVSAAGTVHAKTCRRGKS